MLDAMNPALERLLTVPQKVALAQLHSTTPARFVLGPVRLHTNSDGQIIAGVLIEQDPDYIRVVEFLPDGRRWSDHTVKTEEV